MNTISLQYLSLCFFFTVLFLSLCTIFCIWIWSAPLAMNYFSSDILVFLHVLGPSYGFLYSRSLTTIMPVTNVNVALDKPARLSFSCSLDLLLISETAIGCLSYFGASLWSVATSLNRGKLESKLKAHVKRGSWTELKSIFPGNRDRIGGFDFNMSSIYSSGPFQLVFLDPMHNLIDRITGITHLCRHGLVKPRALSIASYQLHCSPSNCFDF